MEPDRCIRERNEIVKMFGECQNIIFAISNGYRQKTILALLTSDHVGQRVEEITSHTDLSRPAVSHHLKVLKDAGIVSMERRGTKNLYYLSADVGMWTRMSELMCKIRDVSKAASESRYPFLSEGGRDDKRPGSD